MLKDVFLTAFKKNKISSILYTCGFLLLIATYIFSVAGFSVPSAAVYYAFACLLCFVALYAQSHENFKVPLTSIALFICVIFSFHSLIQNILTITRSFTVQGVFFIMAFLSFTLCCFALLICGFAGIKNKIAKIIFYAIGLSGVLFLFVGNCILLVNAILSEYSLMSIFSYTISAFFYILMPLCFYLGLLFETLLDGEPLKHPPVYDETFDEEFNPYMIDTTVETNLSKDDDKD